MAPVSIDPATLESFDTLREDEKGARLAEWEQKFGKESANLFYDSYKLWKAKRGRDNYQEVYEGSKPTAPTGQEAIANATGQAGNVATGAWLGNQIGGGASTTAGITSGAPSAPTIVGASRIPTTIAGNAAGMGVGPMAGIVGGTALLGKGVKDLAEGRTDNSTTGKASRAQTAISTGGISEMARLAGFGDRKTTKDYQQERWGEVANSEDPVTSQYGKQYLDYLGSEQAKTDAQFENTFTGKQQAGTLTSDDVVGAKGNFDAFTDGRWLNEFTEAQRNEIARRGIEQGAYFSNKGDTLANVDKLRAIGDEVLAEGIQEQPVEGESQQVSEPAPQQTSSGGGGRPRPQTPMNELPPILPPEPPQPTIRSPKDYAQAYLDVYHANSSLNPAPTSPIERY